MDFERLGNFIDGRERSRNCEFDSRLFAGAVCRRYAAKDYDSLALPTELPSHISNEFTFLKRLSRLVETILDARRAPAMTASPFPVGHGRTK